MSPLNSFFLQTMGLLGSQASTKKTFVNYELLLSSVFFNFSLTKKILKLFLKYWSVRTKKFISLVRFFGLIVLVILNTIVKGVCPKLLSLLSLICTQKIIVIELPHQFLLWFDRKKNAEEVLFLGLFDFSSI